jgi:hypothetical protein
VTWLTARELRLALIVSVAAALVLLGVRLVQRSTVQFVVNALFGIGIGWLFVRLAASRGGSEDEQALAYFLPGIHYNTGYAAVLAFTCLIGWPIVRLCAILTWLLALPCFLRVVVQGPLWLAGNSGAMDADTAVAILGVLKIGMGWPLQLAALAAMAWVLGRDRTPVGSEPS